MSKFLLILFFVVVSAGIYFNLPDSDAYESGEAVSQSGQTETEQIIDSIRKMFRSWRRSQIPYQPPDDGTRIIADNEPDSDVSDCIWPDLTSDQKIITKFAGFILEYPCTASHRGSWRVVLDENDNVVEQKYRLNLRLQIDEKNKAIWQQKQGVYEPESFEVRFALDSFGSPYPKDLFEQRIAQAEEIAVLSEENLTIFGNPPSLYGVITSEMEDSQNYVFISCSWGGDIDPLKIFSQNRKDDSVGLTCGAHWLLNDNIRVEWLLFDEKSHAHRFSDLYDFVNPKLEEMILGTYEVSKLLGGSSDDIYLYHQRAARNH